MILNPKLLIVDDERGIVDMIQSYFNPIIYFKKQKSCNCLIRKAFKNCID